jgi:carbon monoxide dehydrogenase subunit G
MAEIHQQVTINRSPDDVWAVLGNLADVGWLPGVVSANVEGVHRVCTTSEGTEIHEEISGYSDDERSFSYEQTVHPLGFKSSRGTLAVEDDPAGARVTCDAEIEFSDDAQEQQFLPMLEQGYGAALEGLKSQVEAG